MLKREQGITLASLVVTVIILVILAGVYTYSIIDTPEVGEVTNDIEAIYNDDRKSAEEDINAVNSEWGSVINKKGIDDETVVSMALNSEIKITDPGVKPASASAAVVPLSTTETTELKDNKDNIVKVPKNFGIAFDSGDNVAEGIVIEDTNHNQYVWIPVGTITDSSGASKTIDLIRSNFNGTTTSNAEDVINSYYHEYNATSGSSYGNTKAKNISEFVSSANTNHGYYLARYEAGINASQDQYNYAGCSGAGSSMTITDNSKIVAKDGTVKPLSKAGVGVWNAVTQIEAATICRAMYTKGNDGVESDLVNSFAWDTAIDYIQKCGTASNSDSYATTQGKSGVDTSNSKTTGTNTLLATSSTDQQCKIFDIAGNCHEWSTETGTGGSGSSPCVVRGGNYNGTYDTRNRVGNSTAGRGKNHSFRPLLYM